MTPVFSWLTICLDLLMKHSFFSTPSFITDSFILDNNKDSKLSMNLFFPFCSEDGSSLLPPPTIVAVYSWKCLLYIRGRFWKRVNERILRMSKKAVSCSPLSSSVLIPTSGWHTFCQLYTKCVVVNGAVAVQPEKPFSMPAWKRKMKDHLPVT